MEISEFQTPQWRASMARILGTWKLMPPVKKVVRVRRPYGQALDVVRDQIWALQRAGKGRFGLSDLTGERGLNQTRVAWLVRYGEVRCVSAGSGGHPKVAVPAVYEMTGKLKKK